MTLSVTTDYDYLVQPDRVHGRLYYDQTIFEEELEKIWYREWVYVGHESEIPAHGDYKTRFIGLQPVIMSRDEDGGVHLLMNRCTHRGNTVCQMERGNAHAFRCAYHGWTFANDGKLLGVTYASAYGPDFNRSEYALARVPRMATYRGFIFGSMSAEGPSLTEHLGAAASVIDRYVDLAPAGELSVRAGVHKLRMGANWKMQLENAVDNYHGNFVHETNVMLLRKTGVRSTNFSRDASAALTRDFGRGHTQVDFWPEVRRSGQLQLSGFAASVSDEAKAEYRRGIVERLGEERAQQIMTEGTPHAMIFPNLFLIQSDIRVIQPVSARETYLYQYVVLLKGAPAEMNTQRLRRHEFSYGPAGFILPDDTDIFERNQLALEARSNEWMVLRRGMHREGTDADGFRTGHVTDEMAIRAQWRHYRQLMLRP